MALFPSKYFIILRKKVLSDDIQLRFLKRLSRLLTNGYSMVESLEIIKWDKQLMAIGDQIIIALRNGVPIDQAFDQAKFHHTITAYLYFVRENGNVLSSIEKCVMMFEDRLKYKKKFQEIIRYPLMLLIIFTILLYFIKQYVLPSFIDLFQSSTTAASTIMLSIKMIEFLTMFSISFGVISIVLFLVWHVKKQKINIKTQIKLYRFIPIYRKYLCLQTSFQFATHLSTQLKTGMSLKEVLHNMSKQTKMPVIAYYTSLMTIELNKGFQLPSLLSQLTFFETQLTEIFQKNTNNHSLEKDLATYADLLTEELQRKTMKAITVIQPIFFIVVACFVIFIYLTLMWPMFQLIQTI